MGPEFVAPVIFLFNQIRHLVSLKSERKQVYASAFANSAFFRHSGGFLGEIAWVEPWHCRCWPAVIHWELHVNYDPCVSTSSAKTSRDCVPCMASSCAKWTFNRVSCLGLVAYAAHVHHHWDLTTHAYKHVLLSNCMCIAFVRRNAKPS